jgi:hypothetical protein
MQGEPRISLNQIYFILANPQKFVFWCSCSNRVCSSILGIFAGGFLEWCLIPIALLKKKWCNLLCSDNYCPVQVSCVWHMHIEWSILTSFINIQGQMLGIMSLCFWWSHVLLALWLVGPGGLNAGVGCSQGTCTGPSHWNWASVLSLDRVLLQVRGFC